MVAVVAVAAVAVAAVAAKATVATVMATAEERVAAALKAAWETAVAEAEVEGWVEAILVGAAGRSAVAVARQALRVANTHSAGHARRRMRRSL